MKTYCLVLASGTGSRFGGRKPKQFVRIAGKTVIEHTLGACDCGLFDRIVLVVSAPYVRKAKRLVAQAALHTSVDVVPGGASRKESCRLGVAALTDREARVVIHNGVQPFVTKACFARCLTALRRHRAVTSGVPCVYTVLRVGRGGTVVEMPDRASLYNDMGEECFRLSLLRRLFAVYDDDVSTDIIGLVHRSGLAKVHVVEGDAGNIKITHAEDVTFARKILRARAKEGARHA